MQPKEEIEAHYQNPDPWGYQSCEEDRIRKQNILSILSVYQNKFGSFERALDIGAGEAWITKDLPATTKHAFELSKQACARMPEGVVSVENPNGHYDLIVATGVLYPHYDCATFFRLMREHSSKLILTCNIKAWEHPRLREQTGELHFLSQKEEASMEFKYREFTQKLRLFYLG